MSKDLVSSDELAFLAKRNKEMNVEDLLTAEVVEKVKTAVAQTLNQVFIGMALPGDQTVQETNLVSLKAVQGSEALEGQDEDQMMSVLYRSSNHGGYHLVLVPMSELQTITDVAENLEGVQSVISESFQRFYAEFSTLVEIQSDVKLEQVEVGELGRLATVEQFDLKQLCELKHIQLVFESEGQPLNLMHLSDVSFMDFFYKRMVNEPVALNTSEQPVSSEAETMPKARIVNETIPTEEVYRPQFQPLESVAKPSQVADLKLLADVSLEVSAVLGKTTCSVQELLELNVGAIVELDKMVDDPIEIYANNKLIAEGELVVVDENFGVKLTRLID